MERHDPTLASTRVHALDLRPRKVLCLRSMFPSMSTPFIRLVLVVPLAQRVGHSSECQT
ncbi:hypothetical protein B296_00037301 [Ensete ventricosum]|uniref:Uncharacterized protein n=1 Tax=Ensete ventricosum TaxID=4639 RepID=A0A426XMI0_ENSVE|nr:hypothetical protein B296_00037301 [Ensete ventricosum]